jgi:hypothetical protein
MRFEFCASATLLAVQLLLPKHRSPPPVARAAPISYVEQRADRNNAVEAANLEALWLAHNAGYHAPPCDQYDPLAVLDADLDHGLPGLEHVIGNRRYGVAMYTENHVLIARMPPLGCAAAANGDQSLSLSTHGRLIVHTRELRADGEHLTAHVVERFEDELRQVIEIDLGGDRGDRQVTGAMSFSAGEVEVKYHGRQRAADGGWEAVDDHCTWDLATRSSSCRTRAAARR